VSEKTAAQLRQRAKHDRWLKAQITDPATVQAIRDLAGEAEMAEEMERRHGIRERAHEIWLQRGRPEGRDVSRSFQRCFLLRNS
jgi:hypothetical protein